jgi:hypothetical protein
LPRIAIDFATAVSSHRDFSIKTHLHGELSSRCIAGGGRSIRIVEFPACPLFWILGNAMLIGSIALIHTSSAKTMK